MVSTLKWRANHDGTVTGRDLLAKIAQPFAGSQQIRANRAFSAEALDGWSAARRSLALPMRARENHWWGDALRSRPDRLVGQTLCFLCFLLSGILRRDHILR